MKASYFIFWLVFLFLIPWSFIGFSQTTYVNDDFTDGDIVGWTTGGGGAAAMIGTSNDFRTGTTASAGTTYGYQTMTGLDVTAATTTWTFDATDLHNPSGDNNWGVWLMSNETNLILKNGTGESTTY